MLTERAWRALGRPEALSAVCCEARRSPRSAERLSEAAATGALEDVEEKGLGGLRYARDEREEEAIS